MKIYLDTACIEDIREACSWGIISGVTTNPTIIAREGKDPEKTLKQIAEIVKGPVNAEVISTTADEIIREGINLSRIHKNIVVKIPMTVDGIKAVKGLSAKKIRTNLTLVFSASQALLAAGAGAGYVTPFMGRLDDAGQSGLELIRQIITIYRNYGFKTQVIAASVRNVEHVTGSALAGAHIVTVPVKVLKEMISHPLTDAGIAKFLEDWKKVKGQ